MEGGITRRNGYLILTAALLIVLLIVVLIGLHQSANKLSPQEPVTISQQPDSTSFVKEYNSTPTKASSKSTYSKHNHFSPTPRSVESPPTTTPRKDKQLLFNLNTADSIDLVQLYNIGPAFARRIIRYRNLLGGYVDKRQLWEVKGMDSVRYNDIAPHLYANPDDITPLDLNSVTLDQLKRHPYLDYYQAKAIIQLRETTGPFRNIQDILKIPIIDNETYTHLQPYLTCNSQPIK